MAPDHEVGPVPPADARCVIEDLEPLNKDTLEYLAGERKELATALDMEMDDESATLATEDSRNVVGTTEYGELHRHKLGVHAEK